MGSRVIKSPHDFVGFIFLSLPPRLSHSLCMSLFLSCPQPFPSLPFLYFHRSKHCHFSSFTLSPIPSPTFFLDFCSSLLSVF